MKKNQRGFICSAQIVPVGKKTLIKIGKDLTEKSKKKEVYQKISEIANFITIHGDSLDVIVKENLPLFPKFEKEIIKSPAASIIYSIFFLKKRWKEAEKIIFRDKNCFYIYVLHAIKTRTPELEDKILASPELTYFYCKNVFKRKMIPEEIHNAMIAHAFCDSNNIFVKKYFKMKKVKI